MNSAILFLAIAMVFGVWIVIRSRRTKNAIIEYFSNNALVIDVRSKNEFSQGHFRTAVNIPIDQFEAGIKEVGADKNRPIIVYCHAGSRAAVAETILKKNCFTKVINARNYDALKKYEK